MADTTIHTSCGARTVGGRLYSVSMAKPASDIPDTDMLSVVPCARWSDMCEAACQFVENAAHDPFSMVTVVVPGPAHRRSLSQFLATHGPGAADGEGICAGVEMPSLRELRRIAESQLLGLDADRDPWRAVALGVHLAGILKDIVAPPRDGAESPWPPEWVTLVRNYVEQSPSTAHEPTNHWPTTPEPTAHETEGTTSGPAARPGRLISLAEDVARLFRGYMRHCPSMLRSWDEHKDLDASSQPLATEDRWQAILWRALTENLRPWPHPAARRLTPVGGTGPTDGLFGSQLTMSSLPSHIGVLTLDGLDAADQDFLVELSRHSSVTIWQLTRQTTQQTGVPATTQLQALHSGLPGALHAPCPDQDDHSFSIHLSHGPDRQVEVLRELLCEQFDNDPSLQPRDVAVLCTDISTYGPLLETHFQESGDSAVHPGHGLRARIAGSAVDRSNHVVNLLLTTLALPHSRATSRDLVDLCSLPPVAAKFGFDAEALARLPELLARAEVRWGIDSRNRAELNLGTVRQGTWVAGIDRLLAGLVMADEPAARLDTVVPVAHIDASDAPLIGGLAEFVSRVRMHLLAFTGPGTMLDWHARLMAAAEDLTSPSMDDQWQMNQLSSGLDGLCAGATADGPEFTADEISAMLTQFLRPSRGRPNFGSGSLIMCGLGDLQAIDHRLVVLLGLDDHHFPASDSHVHDDLLARDHVVSSLVDAATRSRQQLVDALNAAREKVIVIGAGSDPLTGMPLPEPVAISDLLKSAIGTWEIPGTGAGVPMTDELQSDELSSEELLARAHERLVVHHTLQPHNAANFGTTPPGTAGTRAGRLTSATRRSTVENKTSAPTRDMSTGRQCEPFSFDRSAFEGAKALAAKSKADSPTPWWRVQSPRPGAAAPEESGLSLDGLRTFYSDPVSTWFRGTFGFLPRSHESLLSTDLPLGTDPLTGYALGTQMLEATLSGQSRDQIDAACLLSGAMPPGSLGNNALMQLWEPVNTMAQRIGAQRIGQFHAPGDSGSGGNHLEVTVQAADMAISAQFEVHGHRLVSYRFARLKAKDLVNAWLELVVASAAGVDIDESVLIMRNAQVRLAAPHTERASQLLDEFIRLRASGLREFLPLPLEPAWQYLGAQREPGMNGERVGRNAFTKMMRYSPLWNEYLGLDWQSLTRIEAEPDDPLTASESRFRNLARWLFEPILDASEHHPEESHR